MHQGLQAQPLAVRWSQMSYLEGFPLLLRPGHVDQQVHGQFVVWADDAQAVPLDEHSVEQRDLINLRMMPGVPVPVSTRRV